MKRGIIHLVLPLVCVVFGVRCSTFVIEQGKTGAGHAADINSSIDPKLLVQRSLDAYGVAGLAGGLKTMRLESTITTYDKDGNPTKGHAVEDYRFPDKVRADIDIGTRKITQLYDGLDAWTIKGVQRTKGPDFIAEGRRRSIKHIPILLLHGAMDDRSILSVVVADTLDNRSVLVLNLTDVEGDQSRLWFDAETFLLVRLDYTLYSSLGAIPVRVMMGRYRAFDGIQTATRVLFYYRDELVQESRVIDARYNPEISEKLFSLPAGNQ